MFDCISDVSHKEQMPHVFKYVTFLIFLMTLFQIKKHV